ncbi:hypothetical protein AZE42_05002 [Rhizopogon vesiculosus]|uniref:Uncharacterized protein n=1 Tax=Rhizopogon vesiculosus TaxID=180088 RepID=A0A1J8QLI0_9AGAM|nr:hypothetical protein AZE42_05002 [Rhizopogon vesiculosus]
MSSVVPPHITPTRAQLNTLDGAVDR